MNDDADDKLRREVVRTIQATLNKEAMDYGFAIVIVPFGATTGDAVTVHSNLQPDDVPEMLRFAADHVESAGPAAFTMIGRKQ